MSAKYWAVVLALLAASLSAACQRFHVESQADQSVNFADYKSYSFSDQSADIPEGFTTGHLFNSIMQRRIRAELYRALTEKGFQQAARSDASFIITFSTGARDDVRSTNPEAGSAEGDTIEGSAAKVTRGALVIHFIDSKTHKVVWRGLVEAVMKPGDDLDQKVRAAVRKVMERFPPSAG